MSDIALINDSQQSAIVTNGIGKNGEIYMKAAGSTDAGALVVYDSGNWRKFADEASSYSNAYSLSFDGSNDSLSLSNSVSFSGACTFSTWINPSVSGASVFLGAAASNFLYAFINNQNITFAPKIGAGTPTTSGVTISNGSWYHVAIIRDASNNITIYVDGVSRATGSYSGTLILPVSLVPISNAYTGLVDEYAIFDSDQSANISSLYNSGVPNDISSLSPLHWWRMGDNDGGTGTTITDQGSGGNDGTINNGPTFSSSVPS